MVVKVKEYIEKTRQVKNNDISKKYVLRGQRNTRYHEKILSNSKNSNNINFISNSTELYTFTTYGVYEKAYDISRKGSHPGPTPTTQQYYKNTNHRV